MLDTKVGTEKDDAAMVAQTGCKSMLTPTELLAKQHRKMAEPGTAEK
jgi:RecG-like helicase